MRDYLRGFWRGLKDFAGVISAFAVIIGLAWVFGNPLVRDYVYEKSGASPAVTTLRHDVDAIVADRKELTGKREQQFEAVTNQINALTRKVDNVDTRITTQLDGLNTLIAQLNGQLNSLNGRLPLRFGSTKTEDRLTAEDPQ